MNRAYTGPRPVRPDKPPIRIVDKSRFVHTRPRQPARYSVDIVVAAPVASTKPSQPRQTEPVRSIHHQPVRHPQPQVQPHSKHSRLQVILIAMAFLVFGLGLLVNIETLQTNHDAKAQVAALAKGSDKTGGGTGGTASIPSETKPDSHSYAAYQVAPNLPKYLKIPKLGVSARVLQVGVTSTGDLGTPTNIYDTAWYTGSAHPGDLGNLGAVLIDGHVHGPTLPGVFMNIKKLVPGDTLQIVRGDNVVFSYRVMKVQNYDASTMNMAMMLASVQSGIPGLNLITCGGPFDTKTNEYTQRTAVFAVQY